MVIESQSLLEYSLSNITDDVNRTRLTWVSVVSMYEYNTDEQGS